MNFGVRESESTGQDPRLRGFGKACLLLGADLETRILERIYVDLLEKPQTLDTPESCSPSAGNADFKTILFFFLCFI